MTNKQTIDGVSRQLLERFAKGATTGAERRELRALLDAERCTSCDGSGDIIDLTGEWRGYCLCPAGVALKNKPVAQHQGEPVAWIFADSIGGIRWRPQVLGSLLDGTALFAQPSIPLPPHSLLQEVLKGWEESAYGDPPVRMTQAIKAVREYLSKAEQPTPLAVEAAKAFAKGFNTLQSGGGKYRINMQFQSREDAWGAFNVLARLKQLNTPQ